MIDLDAEVLEVYAGMLSDERRVEVARGWIAEAGISRQKLQAVFPFIDLPRDKDELVKACVAGVRDELLVGVAPAIGDEPFGAFVG